MIIVSIVGILLLIDCLISVVLEAEPCQEPVLQSRVVGSARDVQVVVGVSLERSVASVVIDNESWSHDSRATDQEESHQPWNSGVSSL